jgi:hypothetical protein
MRPFDDRRRVEAFSTACHAAKALGARVVDPKGSRIPAGQRGSESTLRSREGDIALPDCVFGDRGSALAADSSRAAGTSIRTT